MSDVPVPASLSDYEDPDIIAAEIGKLELKSSDLEDVKNEALDEMAPIDEEIKELEKQKNKLQQKKQAAQKRLQDAQYAKSLLRSKVQELENKRRAALLAKTKRDAWEKESQRLDDLTRTAFWREWAKDHQISGGKHVAMINGRVLIGDDMGTGKSLTSLICADMLDAERVLIISKGEILRNFEKQVEKWTPWRTMFSLVSTGKTHRDVMLTNIIPRAGDEWTLLVNFEAWRKDKTLVAKINKLRPQLVIIDEAHHMKEIDGQAFRGVQNIVYAHNECHYCHSGNIEFKSAMEGWRCRDCKTMLTKDETHSVKHVIPMTGSPILNRPEEMFPLLYLIDRKTFDSKQSFLTNYCEKVQFTNLMGNKSYRWSFRPGGEKTLLKEIGPQFLRRTIDDTDVVLPENQRIVHELEIDRDNWGDQWRVYKQLEASVGAIFNNDGEAQQAAFATITLIQRYRQVTSWPAAITLRETDPETKEKKIVFQCDVKESVKLDKCFELASDMIDAGKRVVIFSKFVGPLEEMHRRFKTQSTEDGKAIRSALYYGDTPLNRREIIKADFDASICNEPGYGPHKYDVVLCQYDAAGEGLNLNGAPMMIRIDEEWSPKKNAQADARIHRFGQTEKTQVHILRIKDTIDTDLGDLLLDKGNMITNFEEEASAIQAIIARLRERVERNKKAS